ncbi:hypothetical protein UCDDS831_g00171 [Diplodia seriata]|uniref:Uncharacterized protein n=1 Tax=Diplodia seriata TaxID=420778 RepID=A0A0G2HKB7_9PEZI|nr:hypothetical protein UCDDS831_g00171 [Diplodia seriata]
MVTSLHLTAKYYKKMSNTSPNTLSPSHVPYPPDPNPGTIRSLPSIAQDQQDDLAASTAALASHRVALADLAAATLDAQTRLVEVVVRVLEQTVHGSAARAARAKAEHLAAVAKGLEGNWSVRWWGMGSG